MKVAIIHNTYQQPGGEDVVVAEETRLLQDQGHDVVSYQRSNHELAQVSGLRRLGAIKGLVSSDQSKRDIRGLIRRERPEIVHVHNTFMVISPSVFEACREEGVAVLQTLHNYRLLCPGWTLSRDGHVCEECLSGSLWNSVRHGCYRNSRVATAAVALMLETHRRKGTWNDSIDGYVALTDFARNKFVQGGLPAHKIHVKPNFVGADPGPKLQAGNYALFVGRLSQEKGVETLLAAWQLLRNAIPLVVIGEGPMHETMAAQVAKNDPSNVTLRGWLPRDQTLAAMKDAAFLVMPSVWYEGFPMTIVESFACGTPVVCSRLGGMQEIVKDGQTGLHFTAGDASGLAAQVEGLLTQRSRIEEMGRTARREYENLYTPEKNYAALMQIYRQTIAAHARNN